MGGTDYLTIDSWPGRRGVISSQSRRQRRASMRQFRSIRKVPVNLLDRFHVENPLDNPRLEVRLVVLVYVVKLALDFISPEDSIASIDTDRTLTPSSLVLKLGRTIS